jgi:hypothetical protein
MSEPDAGEFGKNNPIRLLYKIIAHAAIWIVALLLTAPGLWPLAWMFPLGLVAVIDRHTANAGGWGILLGCYAVYLVHGFSISVRRQRREQSFSTVFSWSC